MLLLDTNAFIWFVGDEDTLSEEIRAEIETNEHIFVSIATFCEMAIKHCKGLLELSNTITELMEICGRLRNSVLQIQINGLHLDVVSQLPLIHKDPFDRLIISQAKVEGLTIVTSDHVFLEYGVPVIKINK